MELHIEQGRRLYDACTDIGIVSGIAGINSYRIRFLGRADHSGTTPMVVRRDAALGASAFALDARRIVMDQFRGCVVNVGNMSFSPGAFNIVPAEVNLALEFRAPDSATFSQMETVLLEQARGVAAGCDLDVEIEWLGKCNPAAMHPTMQCCFSYAAEGLGLTHATFASGAGHDAQSFDGICPIGMVFVPSVDGASHSAREFTRWTDCVKGANVLLQAALRFAQPSSGAHDALE
jgi:N-carbamoyl-L-amino-acid hydrolase